ncbi:MAG TPA: hypothetical protein VNQ31_08620 [Sphingomonadaceae bacterium]|nr:hypothetical protein [Sphingomonadaceae bacterium]
MSGWLARVERTLGAAGGVAAAVAVALVVAALLVLATRARDRRLIASHDALRDAALAEAARAADASAAAARRADDGRLANETIQLNEALADAPSADPPSAARRAYYDCVRLQQAARAAGAPAPAC